MKKSKKPAEIQVQELAEFVGAAARMLTANSSSGVDDKRLLMEIGFSEEVADSIAEGARIVKRRKVEPEAQPVITVERLDRLFQDAERNGDNRAAFKVLRERSKLLGTADHVRPLPEHERIKRPRTATEEALEQLGPVGRAQLDRDFRRELFRRTGRLPNGSRPATTGSAEMKPGPGPATSD